MLVTKMAASPTLAKCKAQETGTNTSNKFNQVQKTMRLKLCMYVGWSFFIGLSGVNSERQVAILPKAAPPEPVRSGGPGRPSRVDRREREVWPVPLREGGSEIATWPGDSVVERPVFSSSSEGKVPLPLRRVRRSCEPLESAVLEPCLPSCAEEETGSEGEAVVAEVGEGFCSAWVAGVVAGSAMVTKGYRKRLLKECWSSRRR